MTAENFEQVLDGLTRRTPFRVFTVELNGGQRFEVDHPAPWCIVTGWPCSSRPAVCPSGSTTRVSTKSSAHRPALWSSAARDWSPSETLTSPVECRWPAVRRSAVRNKVSDSSRHPLAPHPAPTPRSKASWSRRYSASVDSKVAAGTRQTGSPSTCELQCVTRSRYRNLNKCRGVRSPRRTSKIRWSVTAGSISSRRLARSRPSRRRTSGRWPRRTTLRPSTRRTRSCSACPAAPAGRNRGPRAR